MDAQIKAEVEVQKAMKVSNIFDEYDVLQSDPKYGDKYAEDVFGFENVFDKLYI